MFGLIRSVAAFGLGPLVALATAPILARVLGPEGRGQLAAILQPLTVADAIAAFGIPAAVAYFVARGYEPRATQRFGLLGIGVSAVLTYILLFAYSFPVSSVQGIPQPVLASVWSAALIGAVIALRRGLWSGSRSWKRLDLERSASALSRLMGIVLLAAIGVTSSIYFAVAPLVTGIAISLIILFSARYTPAAAPAQRLLAGRFFKYAAVVSLGTIAYTLGSRVDQLLLPLFVNPDQLGIYVVAVTVSEVPLIVGMVLSRNLVAEVAGGKDRRTLVRTYLTAIAVAACGAVAISMLAGWAVPLFFGADFRGAVPIVWILTSASVFSVASAGASAVLNGLGSPWAACSGYVFAIATVTLYVLSQGPGVQLPLVAASVLAGQVLCAATLATLLTLKIRTAGDERGAADSG